MRSTLALFLAAAFALSFSASAEAAPRKTQKHAKAANQERVVKHRRSNARCDCREERSARRAAPIQNPFEFQENDGRAHPTMNNDYWQQSSNYDFIAGKRANLKDYRD